MKGCFRKPEAERSPNQRFGSSARTSSALRSGLVSAVCPISKDLNAVVRRGRSLASAMRRLRRHLQYCRDCPQEAGCGLRQSFNEQVDRVIADLNQEWDLGEPL